MFSSTRPKVSICPVGIRRDCSFPFNDSKHASQITMISAAAMNWLESVVVQPQGFPQFAQYVRSYGRTACVTSWHNPLRRLSAALLTFFFGNKRRPARSPIRAAWATRAVSKSPQTHPALRPCAGRHRGSARSADKTPCVLQTARRAQQAHQLEDKAEPGNPMVDPAGDPLGDQLKLLAYRFH